MSIIVHDQMPLELALSMLIRENKRENLQDVVKKNQYRVKPAAERHEQRKEWAKQKRRRRTASRRLKQKIGS